MKNYIHSTMRGHLSLVTNKSINAARVRRLALKQRYRQDNTITGIRVLLGLYQKRLTLAEQRTNETVEKCQRLITEAVDELFEAKSRETDFLVRKLLSGQQFGDSDFDSLFTANEIDDLEDKVEKLLSSELASRFNNISVNPMLEVNSVNLQDLHDLYGLIKTWIDMKRLTVFISEQVTHWSSYSWNNAIGNMLKETAVARNLEGLNIGTALVSALDVNPTQEKNELFEGITARVQTLMGVIKMRIQHELRYKAAEVTYEVHDRLTGIRMADRIASLEEIHLHPYQSKQA